LISAFLAGGSLLGCVRSQLRGVGMGVTALLWVLSAAYTGYPAEGGDGHLAGDPPARQQHQCLPGYRGGCAHHPGTPGHGQAHCG